jgi:hypothetical protein
MKKTYSVALQALHLKKLRAALCGGQAVTRSVPPKSTCRIPGDCGFRIGQADQNENAHTALDCAVRAGSVKAVFEEEKCR